MRTIVTLMVFLLTASFMAQPTVVTAGLKQNQMSVEAKKGHFQWIFPNGFTKEKIDQLAKYYTSAFTYRFDAKSNQVDVYAVEDSEETRRIILRFLGACQFKTVKVEDKEYLLYEFYDQFMQYNEKE